MFSSSPTIRSPSAKISNSVTVLPELVTVNLWVPASRSRSETSQVSSVAVTVIASWPPAEAPADAPDDPPQAAVASAAKALTATKAARRSRTDMLVLLRVAGTRRIRRGGSGGGGRHVGGLGLGGHGRTGRVPTRGPEERREHRHEVGHPRDG